MAIVLGLDLGANSIGWALLNEKEGYLIDCGVRVFPEPVDPKSKVAKNQARRAARAARRLISRRKGRKKLLLEHLVSKNLLPESSTEREKFFSSADPYALRKKALYEKLEPFEIGRVFYHICQRRGFKSNRKTATAEDGKISSSINSLREEIKKQNCQTLGEFLAQSDKKRGRFTDRTMYEEEFEKSYGKSKQSLAGSSFN